MPTFSVIIPVYNAAKTIERCVDSVAVSGGDDIQIILIEDGGKDNSREVCRRLAEKYDSVTCLFNDRNRGVSYTRNRGLDAATGEYLLFVDSDDWVDRDYVSAFRQAAREDRLAICGYINHDERQNGRTDIYAWDDFEETRTVSVKAEAEQLHRSGLFQQLWNKVFVTRLVREHGVRFDEHISIGEDTRFILDYLRCSGIETITLINRPLYHYMRDQDGSLMFRVGYESVEEPLKNLRRLYELMGMTSEAVDQRVGEDRQKQVESYAYLIMHNAGMPRREKKRLILALDETQGRRLYRKNLVLYCKERMACVLRSGCKG